MTNWGLILKKQEMTRLWVDDKQVPVTLLKLIPQEIIRYKTLEKDGYTAVVVWADKKDLKKDKWEKVEYKYVCEFPVSEEFAQNNKVWTLLDLSLLWDINEVTLNCITKWKWFQWVIRKFHWSLGPKTHWSKFHRWLGGIGNRKPRRVMKGKKFPWHMGVDNRTIKNVSIVDKFQLDNEVLVAVKGSVPWAYNNYVKVIL